VSCCWFCDCGVVKLIVTFEYLPALIVTTGSLQLKFKLNVILIMII
jgi:hypothetical protein